MAWKSESVIAKAKPERIWQIYCALAWQEWDHDIATMTAESTLTHGAKVFITMKDGKRHTATLSDVENAQRFSYSAPLPGAILTATHTLTAVEGGTKITHTFDIDGSFGVGKFFRWLTRDYVQHGLENNTAALKQLAEASEQPR